MSSRSQVVGLAIAVLAAVAIVALYSFGRGVWFPIYLKVAGYRTVTDVVDSVGDDARG